MRGIYDFLIEPIGSRYNNIKKVGDKELILNSKIVDHRYINREAKVLDIPKLVKTNIKPNDTIIVHHNVFRRWHNQHGIEKNSRSYINENTYVIREDQIFAYKRNNKWNALKGYCFVKPIKSYDKFTTQKEQPLMGVIKYIDNNIDNIKKEDLHQISLEYLMP